MISNGTIANSRNSAGYNDWTSHDILRNKNTINYLITSNSSTNYRTAVFNVVVHIMHMLIVLLFKKQEQHSTTLYNKYIQYKHVVMVSVAKATHLYQSTWLYHILLLLS